MPSDAACPEPSGTPGAIIVELTKPRIAVLVLFTVATGVLLASGQRRSDSLALLHAVFGTALCRGCERPESMARTPHRRQMRRTRESAAARGPVEPAKCSCFGLLLAWLGLVYLAVMLPPHCAAVVAAVTFFALRVRLHAAEAAARR